jgi:hypothetical protein
MGGVGFDKVQLLRSLNDVAAADIGEVGSKAATLGELKGAGFAVRSDSFSLPRRLADAAASIENR